MLSNKKILITNDDGIDGVGLITLVKEIYKYTKNIMVLVPSVEMSAVSHMMTLRKGLKFEKRDPIYEDIETYTIDGTPTDCVKFACIHLKYKPDYIISGMNNGLNMGDDILYSGTCAAVFESGLFGIKGIAFSCERGYFEKVKDYICKTIDYIESTPLKDELLLNVNIPENPKGFKKTVQGRNPFNTYFECIDGLYYALGEPCGAKVEKNPESDILAYHNGYISITPLTTDRTKR